MSPESDRPPAGAPDDDGEGPPITVLRSLSVEMDDRFGRRVRGRIDRRVLAGDLVSLGCSGPRVVLLEWLRACLGLLGPRQQP